MIVGEYFIALIGGGNSTKPGSIYYALITAVLMIG